MEGRMEELKVRGGRFFAVEMNARTENACVTLRPLDGPDIVLPISREDRHHIDPRAVYEVVIRKVQR